MRGAAAILALALAGCGGGEPAEAPAPADTAGADRPALPPEAGEDTIGPAPGEWTAGIVRVDPAGPGEPAIVRSVRAAGHETYDRVAWEFSLRRPGVRVEYVDEPVRECGSGRPVALPGDGWLEVRFEPAAAHAEGRSTIDDRRADTRLPVVLEIVVTCDFEAVATWVLAVASPEPYRVTLLDDPPRVAVDVRHPGSGP